MGGLYVDVVAVFVYKSIIRLFSLIGSLRWNRAAAVMLDCSAVNRTSGGCPFVTIEYQIGSGSNSYMKQEEIPFYLYWCAKRYADKCATRSDVVIRVHPLHSSETRFFEIDQKSS